MGFPEGWSGEWRSVVGCGRRLVGKGEMPKPEKVPTGLVLGWRAEVDLLPGRGSWDFVRLRPGNRGGRLW